jgi:hypothetical protein
MISLDGLKRGDWNLLQYDALSISKVVDDLEEHTASRFFLFQEYVAKYLLADK